MTELNFQEIMNFYPTNIDVFNNMKRDYKLLIPFVGAGLSAPWYTGWPNALKKIAEKVYDHNVKQNIINILENDSTKLLEVAQDLEENFGQNGLADHLLSIFSSTWCSLAKFISLFKTRCFSFSVILPQSINASKTKLCLFLAAVSSFKGE